MDALLDACRERLREVEHDDLRLRDVARRAGVTHTTAYTYFSSKEHLVAELHRRLLHELPTPEPDLDAPLADRVADALRGATGLYDDEPHLARAVLVAMVAPDPDSQRIRDEVGAEIARRIRVAAGPHASARLVDAAVLCYSGAMLQAGLGYSSFADALTRVRAAAGGRGGRAGSRRRAAAPRCGCLRTAAR